MSEHKTIPQKSGYAFMKSMTIDVLIVMSLEYKDMQVDHFKSVYTNTDVHNQMTENEMYDISNLMPLCRQCNFYKNTLTLEEFRARLKDTMWEKPQKRI